MSKNFERHATVESIIKEMDHIGYVADEELATLLFLLLKSGKSLLVEGHPGVGKTELAYALAAILDTKLIRLQCYEGLDINNAVYEWNYQKQLLSIKIQETASASAAEKEKQIFGPDYLLKRPLLESITCEDKSPVLLIDEIDRADEEFEAYLLELLSAFQITIPEMGTIKAKHKPFVILTSNRTRELSDALKRRCLFHWIDYPHEEKDLVFDYDKKKLLVSDVMTLKNQVVCLAKSRSDVFLFAIDPNTKEISGPVQKLFPRKYGYKHYESRDKSKTLIFTYGDNNSYHLEVYDQSLQRLWMKDITVVPDEGEFDLKNALVTKNGAIYLYGDAVVKRDNSKGTKMLQNPMIIAVTNDGILHQQKVELQDKFISAYDIILNSSDELKCAGFYSVGDYWHTEGAFDITYDGNLQILNQRTTDIAAMIKSKMLPPDNQYQVLGSLPIIYIGEQKNGDLIIVGQSSSVHSYSASSRLTYSNPATGYNPASSASPSSSIPIYRCSAAVVVRFDTDNKVKFVSVMPMNQEGALPEYLGCAVQNSNDRIFFVYNDDPENEKVFNQYEMKKYFVKWGKKGDSEVMLAVVDIDGTIEKFPLIANKELEATCVPQCSFSISEQKLLVYGDRLQNYRLGIITFK